MAEESNEIETVTEVVAAEPFVYEVRNARWNQHGTIDCEINHSQYDWIETTLNPNDPYNGATYAQVILTPENIAPFVPFTEQQLREQMDSISLHALRAGLTREGKSPRLVTNAINALPMGVEQDELDTDWEYATVLTRLGKLAAFIESSGILTAAKLDAIWTYRE